ncbi:MAG: hypothetical protein ACYCT0_02725, partial [Sulfobacillus sp.]
DRERGLYGEEYAMGDLLHCSTLQQSLFDMMPDFPAGNPWNADIRKDETQNLVDPACRKFSNFEAVTLQ